MQDDHETYSVQLPTYCAVMPCLSSCMTYSSIQCFTAVSYASGDLQAQLEKEVQREKALAEAEGRTKERRANEDVNRRELQLRLEEERKKLVEAINTFFGWVTMEAMYVLLSYIHTQVSGNFLLFDLIRYVWQYPAAITG